MVTGTLYFFHRMVTTRRVGKSISVMKIGDSLIKDPNVFKNHILVYCSYLFGSQNNSVPGFVFGF